MRLGHDDQIVTAWPETCSGPGWANRLIWVLVREPKGKLRIEAMQPDEQTETMRELLAPGEAITRGLTRLVKRKAGR